MKQNKKIITTVLSAGLSLATLACSANSDIAGTEVSNEFVTLTVYQPDGITPAKNTTVEIFSSDDTTHIPVQTTVTDSNGEYQLGHGLTEKKFYNIYSQNDTLASFQDSIMISSGRVNAINDTLAVAHDITGTVTVQNNHNVQTVTAHVLGTYIKTGVDQNGMFTLNNLATGTYTVMCISTIDEYTPFYYELNVSNDTPDTLENSLDLVYTGIPIIYGMSHVSDTANGTVTLSWNKSNYFDLQDYRVYRTGINSSEWPKNPLKVTTDSFFVDTIYGDSLDLASYGYKYRVTISNNSDDEGKPYGSESVTTFSPHLARMIIETDTIKVKDGTAALSVSPSEWFGDNPTVSWDIGGTGTFVESGSNDTTLLFPSDMLLLDYPCIAKVDGVENRVVVDTFYLRNEKKFTELTEKLPFDNIGIESVDELNNSLIGTYRRDNKLGLMKSDNGTTWNIVSDSISNGTVYASTVWNEQIYLLVGNSSYSNYWLEWLIIDSNMNTTIVNTIPQKMQDMYDDYQTIHLITSDEGIALYASPSDWLFDSSLELISKIEDPVGFSGYLIHESVSIDNRDYAICSETLRGTVNQRYPYIFEKKSATIYEEIKYFEYLGSYTNNIGDVIATEFSSGAVIFRNDEGYEQSGKIIYSTDMVKWYEIGEMPTDYMYKAVNFKGKVILFGTGGKLYSFE